MLQSAYRENSSIDIVLAVSLGIMILSTYAIFDILAAISLDVRINLLVGALLLSLAFLFLRYRSWWQQLLVALVTITILIGMTQTDWNSRKPFLRDLNRVELGMDIQEVTTIMEDYISDTSPPLGPISGSFSPSEFSMIDTLIYRHTNQGWGNSDWGVITFTEGKVNQVKFYPD